MKAAQTADILVVGAGLQGCSTALQLARRGRSVLVFEKDVAGCHASGVNAGGVRRLNRAVEEIPISMAALDCWHRMPALVGDDCGFTPSGQVKIAESGQEMELLEERARKVQALGYDHEEIVGQRELRRMVPAVSRHCVGALVCRGDGFADPFRTARAFKGAAESAGARILEHTAVQSVKAVSSGFAVNAGGREYRGEVLVNCAGAWGAKTAAMVGERVPLQPVALTMMVTARRPRFIRPVVGLAARKLSLKQMPNGTVVVGGAHRSFLDMHSERTEIDFSKMRESAQTATDIFPVLKTTPVVRCWAGIEGLTPDRLPIIGPSRVSGAFHAFGFSAHGFQLSPVVGMIMADIIIKGRTGLPIGPFRIERFRNVEDFPQAKQF